MSHLTVSAEAVQSAHFCPAPSFAANRSKQKGRKAEGLRYEAKVREYLIEKSQLYLPNPWIIFIADGRPHWCQPDGLEVDYKKGIVTIIEVKYSHTPEAHRQLRRLYEPVIRRMFPRPSWGVRLVEVVKWFDPDVKFPEPVVMCSDPFNHQGTSIGVHIWRP